MAKRIAKDKLEKEMERTDLDEVEKNKIVKDHVK